MLVTGLYLFPVVEIHIFQRFQCDSNTLFAILVHHPADDFQRQLLRSPATVHTLLHLLQSQLILPGIIPRHFQGNRGGDVFRSNIHRSRTRNARNEHYSQKQSF